MYVCALQVVVREFCLFYALCLGNSPWNPGSSNPLNPPAESIQALTDSANLRVLIYVGESVVPRELAKISVFDSAVQGGDAVWEGLRVYDGRVFQLEEHITRLLDSAKAIDFKNIPSRAYIREAVIRTLMANNMRTGVHMRLTLTRGPKASSSMNPHFNVFGCNLLIVPEYKAIGSATVYNNSSGENSSVCWMGYRSMILVCRHKSDHGGRQTQQPGLSGLQDPSLQPPEQQ